LNIPTTFTGRATCFFRLADKERNAFGPRFWADLLVEQPAQSNNSSLSLAPTVVSTPTPATPVKAVEAKVEEPKAYPVVTPPPAAVVVESEYRAQLDALAVLGFANRELNEYLLRQEKGNVQTVINWLLDNSRQ